jgi:hypothetical protein
MDRKALIHAAIYGATVAGIAHFLSFGALVALVAIMAAVGVAIRVWAWRYRVRYGSRSEVPSHRASRGTDPTMSEADAPPPRPDHAVHAGLAGDHILRDRSVLGIGLGSLLSDAGHEMATAEPVAEGPRDRSASASGPSTSRSRSMIRAR